MAAFHLREQGPGILHVDLMAHPNGTKSPLMLLVTARFYQLVKMYATKKVYTFLA